MVVFMFIDSVNIYFFKRKLTNSWIDVFFSSLKYITRGCKVFDRNSMKRGRIQGISPPQLFYSILSLNIPVSISVHGKKKYNWNDLLNNLISTSFFVVQNKLITRIVFLLLVFMSDISSKCVFRTWTINDTFHLLQ